MKTNRLFIKDLFRRRQREKVRVEEVLRGESGRFTGVFSLSFQNRNTVFFVLIEDVYQKINKSNERERYESQTNFVILCSHSRTLRTIYIRNYIN